MRVLSERGYLHLPNKHLFENRSFFFDRDFVFQVPLKPAPNLLKPVTGLSTALPPTPTFFFTLVLGNSQNCTIHLQQRGFAEEGREWTGSGILVLIAQWDCVPNGIVLRRHLWINYPPTRYQLISDK